PEEKLIVLYLFTGQSNRIGIFNFSPGEAAEDLGMLPQSFAEGFGKVCERLQIGWDETFRVLYLPTWWKYNCPENPNVLKSCLDDLHEVPQTSLIIEFSKNLRYLPETFHQTFREGLPKSFPQRMPHQEQEQEYKSTQSDNPIPDSLGRSRDPKSGVGKQLLSDPQNPPHSKKKKTLRAHQPDPEILAAFDDFYQAFPRHMAKQKALEAWSKLSPDAELTSLIMQATVRYATEVENTDPRYVLHPATWLNDKRWEDEPQGGNANGNGQAKPTEVKDLGGGMVEGNGEIMDKRSFERRYAS